MKKFVLLMLISIASVATAAQTVVFDFGGVMTSAPKHEEVVTYLCDTLKLAQDECRSLIRENSEKATQEDFWLAYSQENEIELSATWYEDFKSVIKTAIAPNPEMYELVEMLKSKEQTVAMLSNVDEHLAKLVREFGLYDPFMPCFLSCDIGLRKPDPKIYEYLLEKLELPASEIVFIDDKPENVEAAQQLGLDAILFQSLDQIRGELQKRNLM